jgi:hypothetical protein
MLKYTKYPVVIHAYVHKVDDQKPPKSKTIFLEY